VTVLHCVGEEMASSASLWLWDLAV